MRDRVTWPDLEAALQARAGWRRVGRAYHGPCPVTGAGRDCCFAAAGRTGVALGCRQCGGRLAGEVFRHHLAALVGETARDVAPHAPHARLATAPSDLPARLWRASEAPEQTPGARYVIERRKAWPAGERLPAAVRWLPGDVARAVGVTPRLPRGAAGCVVYLFAWPGEADTFAAQLEAVDTDGVRVKFYPWRPEDDRAKRPSVSGCTFDGGRRVFRARGDPDLAIHVCEGPLDALALVHLERLDLVELHGGAVHGTSGAALFRPAACPGRGPVTVWAQNDPEHQGQHAAVKLRRALRRAGRDVTIRLPPHGFKDWAEWVQAVGEGPSGTRGNPT